MRLEKRHIVNCQHPSWVYNKYTHERVLSDCGKCPACLNRKSLRHVHLMEEQSRLSRYTVFLTLTYNDFSVPKLYFSPDRKYLVNKKRNISYEIPSDLDDLTFDWLSKKKYVEFSDYKDAQDFIKRFRINFKRYCPLNSALDELKKYNTYEQLLYYCAAEFGPFTARPHFHLLFFFNSDWLAKNFEQMFLKAWSSYNRITHRRFSKGTRSEFRFCDARQTSTFAYTAAYCSSNSDVPSIFQSGQLAPRKAYSKAPILGCPFPSFAEVQKVIYDRTSRYCRGVDKDGKPVIVCRSLSFENRVFPRFSGFSRVPSSSRRFVVELLPRCAKENDGCVDYETFSNWLISPKTQKSLWLPDEVSCILAEKSQTKKPYYDLWLCLNRFYNNISLYGLDVDTYLYYIADYYLKKQYEQFKDFLYFVQEYSIYHRWQDCYVAHQYCDFAPKLENIEDYNLMCSESNKIYNEKVKTKKDRDYQLRGNAVVFNPPI